ncbi:MAG TPA: pyridoxamine 5'-phosphate oxidase family protein [Acidimicrobiia bacterium]|nr:pyridoxamine 5'-phosphate oxidase family protein [Acidimicrobiia bacterium]
MSTGRWLGRPTTSSGPLRARRPRIRRYSRGGCADGQLGRTRASAPGLAAAGRRLIYQYGPGTGYLATVRSDGGPRLHPVCPVVTMGGPWLFVVPSHRGADLERDGRYALHALTPEEVEEEFRVRGRARRLDDPDLRRQVAAAYHAPVPDDHTLFALDVERVLHAAYRFPGDWSPTYTRWSEPREA